MTTSTFFPTTSFITSKLYLTGRYTDNVVDRMLLNKPETKEEIICMYHDNHRCITNAGLLTQKSKRTFRCLLGRLGVGSMVIISGLQQKTHSRIGPLYNIFSPVRRQKLDSGLYKVWITKQHTHPQSILPSVRVPMTRRDQLPLPYNVMWWKSMFISWSTPSWLSGSQYSHQIG